MKRIRTRLRLLVGLLGAIGIALSLTPAPARAQGLPTFCPMGKTQTRLLDQLADYRRWVSHKLKQAGVPEAQTAIVLADLSSATNAVGLWWGISLMGAVTDIGVDVAAALCPEVDVVSGEVDLDLLEECENGDLLLAVWERLSNLVDEFNQAGLVAAVPLGGGVTILAPGTIIPPCWPPPDEVAAPPLIVFWYGLA